jgi:hypothetical protein
LPDLYLEYNFIALYEIIASLRKDGFDFLNLRKTKERVYGSMVPAASNAVSLILEGIMSFLLIVLLYYAMKILTSFKKGMLERGWKYLSQGIIVLVVGEIVITLSNSFPMGGYLFQLGIAIDAVGVCLAVLGFKSHYDIWKIGKETPTAEVKAEIK